MALNERDRERLLHLYAPRLVHAAAGEPEIRDDIPPAPVQPVEQTALVVEEPARDGAAELARSFTVAERKRLADKGQAMPDGSFPIVNEADLASAIRLARTPAQRRHVIKRARALGASDRIPDTWTEDADTSDGAPAWKSLVTTVGTRTLITTAASVETAVKGGPHANPHMLWMSGRFVGGERANRNGAFWSSADLELGAPSVVNGPLNWLHEARTVIGTITSASLVKPGAGASINMTVGGQQFAMTNSTATHSEAAADTGDPHIAATAAIWKWIYPDQAAVVQMASDAGVLAYSMECISEQVQCVGDNGCERAFSYGEYVTGKACAHLTQRASTRRLVNPTFLGGAVIVPPARPGWADADARVLAAAHAYAETAYDQAGRPDVPAATWEALMTGVLTYASTPGASR